MTRPRVDLPRRTPDESGVSAAISSDIDRPYPGARAGHEPPATGCFSRRTLRRGCAHTRIQAARCPGRFSRGGTATAHSGIASGQRSRRSPRQWRVGGPGRGFIEPRLRRPTPGVGPVLGMEWVVERVDLPPARRSARADRGVVGCSARHRIVGDEGAIRGVRGGRATGRGSCLDRHVSAVVGSSAISTRGSLLLIAIITRRIPSWCG